MSKIQKVSSRANARATLLVFINYQNHTWGTYVLSGFNMAHVRMKSNDVHQGWVLKVQDKHLKKIICLKLVVHLVIIDLWRWVLMKLSHNGLWGRKLKSSRSNNDQVRHSGLTGAWSIIIKIKRDAKGKGMSLLGFPFTGVKVFVGRPGYRIDSRTIKRGFRLGNLITSS
jgi:hypothetical protein